MQRPDDPTDVPGSVLRTFGTDAITIFHAHGPKSPTFQRPARESAHWGDDLELVEMRDERHNDPP
jgi:hypothetical protein